MRKAHPLSLTAIVFVTAIAAAASPLAFAQTTSSLSQPQANTPTQDHSVFSPSAPTLLLLHQPLAASGAIVVQPGDWKAANAAVAEFPRGHGDVLKWEKAQNSTTKNTDQAAPAHSNHHGGQR